MDLESRDIPGREKSDSSRFAADGERAACDRRRSPAGIQHLPCLHDGHRCLPPRPTPPPRENSPAALPGRDSNQRVPLLASRYRHGSADEWPGLGPDRLELLRVRLECSCWAEPFQSSRASQGSSVPGPAFPTTVAAVYRHGGHRQRQSQRCDERRARQARLPATDLVLIARECRISATYGVDVARGRLAKLDAVLAEQESRTRLADAR
jgi:hypothetical protein